MTRAEQIHAEVDAVFTLFRNKANASGYGWWISDDKISVLTRDAVNAVEGVAHNDDRSAQIHAEVAAVVAVLRADFDASGYGKFFSDGTVHALTVDAVNAIEGIRTKS